ncbi:hypothetical protein [Paenibacillus amylolyticus]|uniref:hypothetical protein n=1 Tax=Paenibacillus amylolyticus TaxID=1451 RepID=UPI003EBE9441
MGYLLNKAVERLKSINDVTEEKLQESHHILILEYFRRVNLFLDRKAISIDRYPIFSFAKIIGETINDEVYDCLPKLNIFQNVYIKAVCYSFLEISELADRDVEEAYKHIDLFEPIIKFLERGGSFTIRQGEMMVGNSTYPLIYWRDKVIEEQDISERTLQILDERPF